MTKTTWMDAGTLADTLGGSKERLIEAARQNVAYREYSVEERECPKEERTHNRQRYQYRATSWADSGSRPKHRIPKPPLTIVEEEEGSSLDADTSGRLARLEQRIDTLSKKITWDEEDLDLNEELVQQVFRRIDDTLVSQTEQIRYELRGVVEDKVNERLSDNSQVGVLRHVEKLAKRIANMEELLAAELSSDMAVASRQTLDNIKTVVQELYGKVGTLEHGLKPDHGARIDAIEESAKASAASIEMLQTGQTDGEIERFGMRERIQHLYDRIQDLERDVTNVVALLGSFAASNPITRLGAAAGAFVSTLKGGQ